MESPSDRLDDSRPLDDVVEGLVAGRNSGGCVLLYRGLDCNLTRSDGCRELSAGRTPVVEERFARSSYVDGFAADRLTTAEVQLALYAWTGRHRLN
jgi:hypothetical protein